jgi:hypothetical protein
MPIPEGTRPSAEAGQPEAGTAGPSRRSLLRGAVGAGAAGLAVTALASPALATGRSADPGRAHPHAADDGELADDPGDATPMVVHVLNVHSGEMDVYRGTSHVRVQDQALAARLARASR